MARSLTISSHYTWGKALDYSSQNANGTLHSAFNAATDPHHLKAFRGLSDFDLSHSFAATFLWQVPSYKREDFFSKHVLSGWQVSGIWVWQSGYPFSVYSGIDDFLTGVGLDYADRVPGVSPFLSPDRPRAQLVNEYYNPAAFQPNALGTFGKSGRNILRGPGYNNLDFSLMKIIPFHERFNATLRAEAFNLTSTLHLLRPGAGS